MLRTSIARRWDTSKLQQIMIETLPQDLLDADPRVRRAARDCVIAMESQNQKDEHKFLDAAITQRNAELDELAADLGIEVNTVEAIERKAALCDLGVKENHEQAEHERARQGRRVKA